MYYTEILKNCTKKELKEGIKVNHAIFGNVYLVDDVTEWAENNLYKTIKADTDEPIFFRSKLCRLNVGEYKEYEVSNIMTFSDYAKLVRDTAKAGKDVYLACCGIYSKSVDIYYNRMTDNVCMDKASHAFSCIRINEVEYGLPWPYEKEDYYERKRCWGDIYSWRGFMGLTGSVWNVAIKSGNEILIAPLRMNNVLGKLPFPVKLDEAVDLLNTKIIPKLVVSRLRHAKERPLFVGESPRIDFNGDSNWFSLIRCEVSIVPKYANIEFLKEHGKELMNYLKEEIESKKKFQKIGVPMNYFKVGQATLTRMQTMVFTFQLKTEHESDVYVC